MMRQKLSWVRLFLHYRKSSKPLDVVAIDHFPSLLPRESSTRFANDSTPHLLKLDQVNCCNIGFIELNNKCHYNCIRFGRKKIMFEIPVSPLLLIWGLNGSNSCSKSISVPLTLRRRNLNTETEIFENASNRRNMKTPILRWHYDVTITVLFPCHNLPQTRIFKFLRRRVVGKRVMRFRVKTPF